MQLTLPAAPPPATYVPSVQLLHGDCLKMMPMLPQGCAHMVFADLPYGMVRRKWDIRIDLQDFWRAVAMCSQRGSKSLLTAVMPFASDVLQSNRNNFRHDLVWDKCRTTGFLNANKRPMRRHEHILIFAKGKGVYNPQKTISKPYAMRRRNHDHNYMDNLRLNNKVTISNGDRYPTSILSVPSATEKSIHPTQKPIALLEWLILTYTNEGDTVLDPVSGSATTAVAALRTGRNAICIEKDLTFFEAGRKRVAEEQARLGLSVTV